jgi:hypothetical protein
MPRLFPLNAIVLELRGPFHVLKLFLPSSKSVKDRAGGKSNFPGVSGWQATIICASGIAENIRSCE